MNKKFCEIVMICEALRAEYIGFLSPFFDIEKVRFYRDMIYSLPFEEWRRDRLWEYLNGDIEFDVLLNLI